MGIAIPLFILGALGASNLIIARKPSAKELLAKVAPYQGWLGAGMAVYGIYNIVFWVILGIGYLTTNPVGYIVGSAVSVMMFALGMLFGVGTLKTFVKQPQAVAKMDQVVTKLAPYQGTLGIIGMITAIAFIAVGFLGL
ncbi:MAG: hypothetical protein JKY37_11005 [Nannocystaceae bacterium]|nr:hypothetical protein [Nannocystaceae bacterium]